MTMMRRLIGKENRIGGLVMMLGWDWNKESCEKVVCMCMEYGKALGTQKEVGIMAQGT